MPMSLFSHSINITASFIMPAQFPTDTVNQADYLHGTFTQWGKMLR